MSMNLIDRLPGSYKELNYKKYVAIINKIPSERPDSLSDTDWSRIVHLTTLSILLDMPAELIEQLGAKIVFAMIAKIAFLDKPLTKDKSKFKVKAVDELSFDEFATYQRLRLDQWNNLGDILLLVLKGATPEQVDGMSIHDAMQVFFCLNKSTKRFLTRLKYSTMLQATKQVAKRSLSELLTRSKERQS